MNYDNIFDEDIEKKFFYTDYPGNKLMVGRINLRNAISRLSKDEYYALVTYNAGEELPNEYMSLDKLASDDGTLFATVNSNVNLSHICKNGGIQMISKLPNAKNGSPVYLLGPGPDKITLESIIMEQYNMYSKTKDTEAQKGK